MNFDFSKEHILENDRVIIKPLTKEDAENLYPISIDDPELLEYFTSQFNSKALFNEYFNETLNAKAEENRYPFSIYDKEKKLYAGTTSFGNISNKDKRLEIGWTWLGSQFQRSGLNRNCKFLLLSYLFDTLGFERVELKTDSRNKQSRDAIEGIGAKFEGELRSHILMSNGHRRNTVYYSILKKEWPSIRRSIFNNIK